MLSLESLLFALVPPLVFLAVLFLVMRAAVKQGIRQALRDDLLDRGTEPRSRG